MAAPSMALALDLPQSPLGAVVFTAVVLTVVYGVLRTFIRTGANDENGSGSSESELASGSHSEREETASSAPAHDAASGDTDTEPVVVVEAVLVRDMRIAISDPASLAMRAVHRNEAIDLPQIDRDALGRAVKVLRQYKIAGQPISFVFERDAAVGILRVSRILVGQP